MQAARPTANGCTTHTVILVILDLDKSSRDKIEVSYFYVLYTKEYQNVLKCHIFLSYLLPPLILTKGKTMCQFKSLFKTGSVTF